MHITGAEFGFGGTLLGAIVGSVGSYLGTSKAASRAAAAQREVLISQERIAAEARVAAQRDEIDREVRAHKRDAYINIMARMSDLQGSTSILDYTEVCPPLANPSDADFVRYSNWTSQRFGYVSEAEALATAHGSDEMLDAVVKCAHAVIRMGNQLRHDAISAINAHDNDAPTTRKAFGPGLWQQFESMVKPVHDSAAEVKTLVRMELHLTSPTAADDDPWNGQRARS